MAAVTKRSATTAFIAGQLASFAATFTFLSGACHASSTDMQSLPTVLLKPGEADRILAGHPWIYHSSVLRLTQPAADGEVVQVKDHRQRLLGVGFYNSKSKI